MESIETGLNIPKSGVFPVKVFYRDYSNGKVLRLV